MTQKIHYGCHGTKRVRSFGMSNLDIFGTLKVPSFSHRSFLSNIARQISKSLWILTVCRNKWGKGFSYHQKLCYKAWQNFRRYLFQVAQSLGWQHLSQTPQFVTYNPLTACLISRCSELWALTFPEVWLHAHPDRPFLSLMLTLIALCALIYCLGITMVAVLALRS